MQPDENSRWKIKNWKSIINFFLPRSLNHASFAESITNFYQVQWPFLQRIDNSNSVSTYICKTQPAKTDWPAPWWARQSHAWFSSAIWLRHHQLIQKKHRQLMQKKLKSCTASSRLAFTIPINWIGWETVVMQKAWGRERDCERYTALLLAGIYC